MPRKQTTCHIERTVVVLQVQLLNIRPCMDRPSPSLEAAFERRSADGAGGGRGVIMNFTDIEASSEAGVLTK